MDEIKEMFDDFKDILSEVDDLELLYEIVVKIMKGFFKNKWKNDVFFHLLRGYVLMANDRFIEIKDKLEKKKKKK